MFHTAETMARCVCLRSICYTPYRFIDLLIANISRCKIGGLSFNLCSRHTHIYPPLIMYNVIIIHIIILHLK